MTLLEFSSTVRTRLFDSELGVVLTGGGGWLGQATLEMLDSSFGSQMTSRTHVFASRRRSITLRSGTHLEVYPLHELDHLKIGPHVLVHYAFATRELVSELGVAQYIAPATRRSRSGWSSTCAAHDLSACWLPRLEPCIWAMT